jgi:hypothetical protein
VAPTEPKLQNPLAPILFKSGIHVIKTISAALIADLPAVSALRIQDCGRSLSPALTFCIKDGKIYKNLFSEPTAMQILFSQRLITEKRRETK